MDANPLRRILVVDDESNVVKAVARELNSPPFVRYRYQVEGFTDPQRALELAREQTFDAVICDYRMPGMDGLEFLRALALIQPDCICLVLSGQTDREALIHMINEIHIYRFIPKPWHDYYLKGSLYQAIDYGAALSENRRLSKILREQTPLPIEGGEMDQLLIVDDDPGILNSISRALTHYSGPTLNKDRLSIHLTQSPIRAIEMAEKIQFSCIIADFKMPEMSGIDLLQKFYDLQPGCARILLSGQITKDDLIYAIDSPRIFAFIDKPWTDYDLKACIALALARRRIDMENAKLAQMVKASSQAS
ncbi:MAG: response regulator [Betaproteobacteria bacterium]|nr:response regulator [Betaproteobacteria bacterium]